MRHALLSVFLLLATGSLAGLSEETVGEALDVTTLPKCGTHLTETRTLQAAIEDVRR